MKNGWKRTLTIVSVVAAVGAAGVATVTLHGITTREISVWYAVKDHMIETEAPGGLIDQFKTLRDGQAGILGELRGLRADAAEDRRQAAQDRMLLYRMLGTLDAEGRAYVRDGGRKP